MSSSRAASAKRSTSADRNEWHSDIQRTVGALAEIFPDVGGPAGAGTILEQLVIAERPGEWNSTIGSLLGWALSHEVPVSVRDDPRYRTLLGRLTFQVARGFQAPCRRPSDLINDAFDAQILEIAGARPKSRILILRGLSSLTAAEAEELRRSGSFKIRDGIKALRDWFAYSSDVSDELLRKRVKRIAARHGIYLPTAPRKASR